MKSNLTTVNLVIHNTFNLCFAFISNALFKHTKGIANIGFYCLINRHYSQLNAQRGNYFTMKCFPKGLSDNHCILSLSGSCQWAQ